MRLTWRSRGQWGVQQVSRRQESPTVGVVVDAGGYLVDERARGLAEKGKTGRLAIRFETEDAMDAFRKANRFPEAEGWGGGKFQEFLSARVWRACTGGSQRCSGTSAGLFCMMRGMPFWWPRIVGKTAPPTSCFRACHAVSSSRHSTLRRRLQQRRMHRWLGLVRRKLRWTGQRRRGPFWLGQRMREKGRFQSHQSNRAYLESPHWFTEFGELHVASVWSQLVGRMYSETDRIS